MTIRPKKSVRKVAGVAVLAAVISAIPLVAQTADALPPGTQPTGGLNLTPSSGSNTQNFTLSFTTPPGACPGDSNGGWSATTFLTPYSNDPAQLVFDTSGVPTGPAVTGNLRQPGGSAASVGIALGNLNVNPGSIGSLSFANSNFNGLATGGAYWLGIACYNYSAAGDPLDGQNQKFWATPITFIPTPATPATPFRYVVGLAPNAPTGVSVTGGNAQLGVSWNTVPSTPSVTAYRVTATSAGNPTVVSTVTTTSTTLTGLVNDSTYTVTIIAVNAAGESPASTPVPGVTGLQPPTGLTATSAGPGAASLSWSAPVNSPALLPDSYTLTLTGGPSTQTFTGLTGLTYAATGLTAGTNYAFTVTAVYPTPNAPKTSASQSFTVNAAQLLYQNITTSRPAGDLIITQRCGVYGALATYPTNLQTLFNLSLPATAASVDTVGTPPSLSSGGTPNFGTTPPDPKFGDYPYPFPPNYPTNCGVNMQNAKLITSGALAGQYYAAQGRLNQVTVIDTRDGDNGWNLKGQVSNFTRVGGAGSFSGNFLGWLPTLTSTSPTNAAGYSMSVTPGASVEPRSGLPGGPAASGLNTAKQTLASAPGSTPLNQGPGGLGQAVVDARLVLLIPVTALTGDYRATLSIDIV